VTELHIQLN